MWFDAQDLSSMRQETTGASATTAVAEGDPVGTWRNKGILGGYAVAASNARRPILRKVGTRYRLQFDGVDDYLKLVAPGISLVTVEIFLGIEIVGNSGSADGILTFAPASPGSDFNSNNGFTIYTNYVATDIGMQGGAGSAMSLNTAGLIQRPHLVEIRKPDNSSASMVVDNGDGGSDSALATFGAMTGDLILGARVVGGTVQTPGSFYLYGLVIACEVIQNRTLLRAYMENVTGNSGPEYPAIADLTALTAARNTLITDVFGGGGLPASTATLTVEDPNPLNGVVTFTSLYQCEKMTIPGYANRPRLWTPTLTRNDAIVLLCAGHSAGWANNGINTAMQTLLTAGIRVCTFVLPGGANDYTSGTPAQHEGVAPAEWVGPIVIAVNTLRAAFPDAAIYIAGISGGGWMSLLGAACDARIAGCYQFVGSIPDYVYINRDYEQLLGTITADYLTLYMLAACPGRDHNHVLYENDPVGFNRTTYNTRPDWSVGLASRCVALGSGVYELSWVDYNLHALVEPSFTDECASRIPAGTGNRAAINWGPLVTDTLQWGGDVITWGT